MGDIYLDIIIAPTHHPERQRDVQFLVDTGATRAWIPKEMADELGIQVMGNVPTELADGKIKRFPYGSCFLTYEGETVAGNIIIGPPGSEPLVGTHVLQDFRLIIDTERHEIKRGRAMRAKKHLSP
jgi:predicted aspartyl protease